MLYSVKFSMQIYSCTTSLISYSPGSFPAKNFAASKAIFAKGALEAAKFLAGKEPGRYTMADVVGL